MMRGQIINMIRAYEQNPQHFIEDLEKVRVEQLLVMVLQF